MNALFHPVKTHHIDPICGCGIIKCPEWDGIKRSGKKKVYQNIFDRHPEINTIIDSGKDPEWIKEQARNLEVQKIDVKHLIIWKTPYEFAFSLSKRGKEDRWNDLWAEYHLRYFSVVKEFHSVKSSTLIENPATILPVICKQLGITYIEGQEDYWNKRHHTLFGSAASRIHLHASSSSEFKRLEKFITRKESNGQKKFFDINKYRTIHFKKIREDSLKQDILEEIKNNRVANTICDWLVEFDITNDQSENNNCSLRVQFPYKPDFGWYYKSITRRAFLQLFKIKTQIYLEK